MLYILSRSPYTCDLTALLRTVQYGDDLVLLADGVIASLINSSAWSVLNESPLKLHALENDLVARGLFSYYEHHIAIISYTDFVKLTEKQSKQLVW